MSVNLVGFMARLAYRVPPRRYLYSLTGRATVWSADESLARVRRRLMWMLTTGTAILLVNALAIALGWYPFL